MRKHLLNIILFAVAGLLLVQKPLPVNAQAANCPYPPLSSDGRRDAWAQNASITVNINPSFSQDPSLGLRRIDLEYFESRRVDPHGNRFKFRAKVRDAQGYQLGRWAWDVFLVRKP